MTSGSSRAHARPPFTNAEVFGAVAVFLPDDTVDAARREFPGAPDDPFEGHLTDGVLLVMCTLSEELAARVTAYRPELAPRVKQVLRDPEEFIRSLRNGEDG